MEGEARGLPDSDLKPKRKRECARTSKITIKRRNVTTQDSSRSVHVHSNIPRSNNETAPINKNKRVLLTDPSFQAVPSWPKFSRKRFDVPESQNPKKSPSLLLKGNWPKASCPSSIPGTFKENQPLQNTSKEFPKTFSEDINNIKFDILTKMMEDQDYVDFAIETAMRYVNKLHGEWLQAELEKDPFYFMLLRTRREMESLGFRKLNPISSGFQSNPKGGTAQDKCNHSDSTNSDSVNSEDSEIFLESSQPQTYANDPKFIKIFQAIKDEADDEIFNMISILAYVNNKYLFKDEANKIYRPGEGTNTFSGGYSDYTKHVDLFDPSLKKEIENIDAVFDIKPFVFEATKNESSSIIKTPKPELKFNLEKKVLTPIIPPNTKEPNFKDPNEYLVRVPLKGNEENVPKKVVLIKKIKDNSKSNMEREQLKTNSLSSKIQKNLASVIPKNKLSCLSEDLNNSSNYSVVPKKEPKVIVEYIDSSEFNNRTEKEATYFNQPNYINPDTPISKKNANDCFSIATQRDDSKMNTDNENIESFEDYSKNISESAILESLVDTNTSNFNDQSSGELNKTEIVQEGAFQIKKNPFEIQLPDGTVIVPIESGNSSLDKMEISNTNLSVKEFKEEIYKTSCFEKLEKQYGHEIDQNIMKEIHTNLNLELKNSSDVQVVGTSQNTDDEIDDVLKSHKSKSMKLEKPNKINHFEEQVNAYEDYNESNKDNYSEANDMKPSEIECKEMLTSVGEKNSLNKKADKAKENYVFVITKSEDTIVAKENNFKANEKDFPTHSNSEDSFEENDSKSNRNSCLIVSEEHCSKADDVGITKENYSKVNENHSIKTTEQDEDFDARIEIDSKNNEDVLIKTEQLFPNTENISVDITEDVHDSKPYTNNILMAIEPHSPKIDDINVHITEERDLKAHNSLKATEQHLLKIKNIITKDIDVQEIDFNNPLSTTEKLIPKTANESQLLAMETEDIDTSEKFVSKFNINNILTVTEHTPKTENINITEEKTNSNHTLKTIEHLAKIADIDVDEIDCKDDKNSLIAKEQLNSNTEDIVNMSEEEGSNANENHRNAIDQCISKTKENIIEIVEVEENYALNITGQSTSKTEINNVNITNDSNSKDSNNGNEKLSEEITKIEESQSETADNDFESKDISNNIPKAENVTASEKKFKQNILLWERLAKKLRENYVVKAFENQQIKITEEEKHIDNKASDLEPKIKKPRKKRLKKSEIARIRTTSIVTRSLTHKQMENTMKSQSSRNEKSLLCKNSARITRSMTLSVPSKQPTKISSLKEEKATEEEKQRRNTAIAASMKIASIFRSSWTRMQ